MNGVIDHHQVFTISIPTAGHINVHKTFGQFTTSNQYGGRGLKIFISILYESVS